MGFAIDNSHRPVRSSYSTKLSPARSRARPTKGSQLGVLRASKDSFIKETSATVTFSLQVIGSKFAMCQCYPLNLDCRAAPG